MSHYADLTPCGYFGVDYAPGLRSIGWLEKEHPYNRGPVSPEFTTALKSLLIAPWQPFVFAGFHRCRFCRITGGPSTFPTITGTEIQLGGNNLYIPGDGFLYVAPSTIIHYIDAHEYAPPDEFQIAVLNCPEMRSMPYLKLIRANAPPGFLQRFRSPEIPTGEILHEGSGPEAREEREPE
jgi:hypothetical protein